MRSEKAHLYEDKDLCFIPRTVWQKSVKELTDYPRIQKLEERLKKQGMSKEEVEKIIKKEWQRWWFFKNPSPVVVTNRGEKEEDVPVQYVDTSSDQEEVIYNVQKGEMPIKTLEECKETLFKRSSAGKATINYFLKNKDNQACKLTNREIAKKTGFNEDVICRVRKRLKLYLSKKFPKELIPL